jgi:NAD(P)-dependent dehydrogenase (short-subunit alcohol dehydrogenase family)
VHEAAIEVEALPPRLDTQSSKADYRCITDSESLFTSVTVFPGKVTRKTEVEALYDSAIAEFGKVDVSIQNAGVITIARIEELSENDWDRIMAVNTKGVFLCCQAAAVRMKPHRSGRIINTASTGQTINVDGGLIMS